MAAAEVCGLWHVSYPCNETQGDKEGRFCWVYLGFCGERPPAHSPQGWCEHGRALPAPGVGGLGAGRVSQPSNKKRNSITCYK